MIHNKRINPYCKEIHVSIINYKVDVVPLTQEKYNNFHINDSIYMQLKEILHISQQNSHQMALKDMKKVVWRSTYSLQQLSVYTIYQILNCPESRKHVNKNKTLQISSIYSLNDKIHEDMTLETDEVSDLESCFVSSYMITKR